MTQTHEPVPGYDNDDQLRRYALDEQRLHDPEQQDQSAAFPNRCAHCHYTRHPCDVHELATAVLWLLDRGRTDDPWETPLVPCYACGKGPLVIDHIVERCANCRAAQPERKPDRTMTEAE